MTILKSTPKPPLNKQLWRNLCHFGITKIKPTRRGCRSGKRITYNPPLTANEAESSEKLPIKPIYSSSLRMQNRPFSKPANRILIEVPIINEQCKSTTNSLIPKSDVYPVPKFMLSNICSLNKTVKKVRASTALAADMRTLDTDIAIISDTLEQQDT